MSTEKGKHAHRQLTMFNTLFEGRIHLQKTMGFVTNDAKVLTEDDKDTMRAEVVGIFTRLAELQQEMLDSVTHVDDEDASDDVDDAGEDSDDNMGSTLEDGAGRRRRAPGQREEVTAMNVLRRWCGKRDSNEDTESDGPNTSHSSQARKKSKMSTNGGVSSDEESDAADAAEESSEDGADGEDGEDGEDGKDFGHLLLAMDTVASANHERMKVYVSSTVDKWYAKTKLAAGGSKQFRALDQSLMAKVNSIAREKQTTQTKAFDDQAFYYSMLKEFIEHRASSGGDPTDLARHFLEIDALRKKVKKTVDTRASKGRKLRYDVHPKLANFTAPVDALYSVSDSARQALFSSLFQHTSE